MRGGRIWAIGGFVAGAVLILFGVAALYLGVTSYQLVHDELANEKIVGGEDMSPEAISAGIEEAGLEDVEAPDCDVVDEEIDTGEEARCFASYMRIHALEATGGLTYAEMGRFQSADDPGDPAGTNDEAEAAKDEEGNPISNGQRNLWINETALATALNVSYMAEQISIFGIVVGIALLITGIGLLVLAYAVFVRGERRSRRPRRSAPVDEGRLGTNRAPEAVGEPPDLLDELRRLDHLEVDPDHRDVDRQAAEPVGSGVQQARVVVDRLERPDRLRHAGGEGLRGAVQDHLRLPAVARGRGASRDERDGAARRRLARRESASRPTAAS